MKATKKSELGIISFVLSLLPILLLAIHILIHALFEITSDSTAYKYYYETGIAGIMIKAILPILVASVITGVIGLFQENYKKTYVKIGFLIAGIQLFAIAAIWIWAEMQHFS